MHSLVLSALNIRSNLNQHLYTITTGFNVTVRSDLKYK